jgi:protein-tyrosine phosphatase
VIDLHCHLLPGLDDGPATTAAAVRLAREAWEAGTRTVVATPHMLPRYPTTPEQVRRGIAALRTELDRAGIPLQVLPGGEIALDFLPRLREEELRAATLGAGGRWLLLEMPYRGWPLRLPEILDGLAVRGFGVVLAHPERAESVQLAPDRVRDLVGRGALLQLTAASFTGEHGGLARRTAETLLRDGYAHFLASDAHGPVSRGPSLVDGLAAAARSLGIEPGDLSWMVEEGPRLVIEGRAIRPPRLVPTRPPRPDAARGARVAPPPRRG